MRGTGRTIMLAIVVAGALPQRSLHAQIVGSFDGSVTGKKTPQPIAAAGVLTQTGKTISGTVALPGDLATFGGTYLVQGKATPKRIRVSGGGGTGAFLKWAAKITGTSLTGTLKVKAPGAKLAGSLTFVQNPAFASNGSTCDAVYVQNQTLFTDQVLAQALGVCSTCHAAGLQASATRLRVDAADPLATARAVALFVDTGNPSASLILAKPRDLVPHGGGAQLTPGSPEDLLLEQWVALVAAAGCN